MRRGRGGKDKEWTDCVQSDIRAFGITRDWKVAAFKAEVWVETVAEGGRRFMAAWKKEEVDAARHRHEKREATKLFFFFFFFFFHLSYSRWTSSLPSCLWSQRIFPSLPGLRLTIFLSRCKFSTLTTRQPMVEFYLLTFPRFPLRKKEHRSYLGKNRTHDFRTSRCAAYLLDHSGDDWESCYRTRKRRILRSDTHWPSRRVEGILVLTRDGPRPA